mgnify:CR=1 FL=1
MTAISALTAATSRQQRDPSRIGQIRPSHLMTSAGIGAVVDLPALSVIVRGLDSWPPEHQVAVPEPRLLDEVRRVLGPQVRSLRSAPYDPDADPWSRIGVPVQPFPGWVRCPACFRLGLLDGDAFKVHHRWASRPDLAKVVHAQGCGRQQTRREGNRRACIPARFVVACEQGHLDDFPYVEYVHRGGAMACDGPQLTLQDGIGVFAPELRGPERKPSCATVSRPRSLSTAWSTAWSTA